MNPANAYEQVTAALEDCLEVDGAAHGRIRNALAILPTIKPAERREAQQPVECAVVPKEITLEMQKAYSAVIDDNLLRVDSDATFGRFENQKQAYRAMLAAAPPASAPKRETVNAVLNVVAQIAATCMIDLRYNLKEARQEWLDGKIAKGAYEHVQHRHDSLHAALNEAGFTEEHKFFKYSVRPTTQIEGEQPPSAPKDDIAP